jgi:hypothetical protein
MSHDDARREFQSDAGRYLACDSSIHGDRSWPRISRAYRTRRWLLWQGGGEQIDADADASSSIPFRARSLSRKKKMEKLPWLLFVLFFSMLLQRAMPHSRRCRRPRRGRVPQACMACMACLLALSPEGGAEARCQVRGSRPVAGRGCLLWPAPMIRSYEECLAYKLRITRHRVICVVVY